jgi:hypothetical protein
MGLVEGMVLGEEALLKEFFKDSTYRVEQGEHYEHQFS